MVLVAEQVIAVKQGRDLLDQIWGWSQFGGALLALAALVFAGWSVHESRTAAKAARESADVAREELEMLKHAGETELVAEHYDLYENPASPFGWQVTVDFRSEGRANAYSPDFWLVDTGGNGLNKGPDHWPGARFLEPGQPERDRKDVPAPPNGDLAIWLGRRDARGLQERQTDFHV